MTASNYFSNKVRYRAEDHPAQSQLTPEYILGPVREAFGGSIELDPCTTPDNPAGAERFFAPPVDGAAQSWLGASAIYVNPPYGEVRERWVRRCIEAASLDAGVILLMPANATETRTFQRALATASGVVFIQARIKFGVLRPNRREAAASHGSALFGWNVDLTPCAHLGVLAAAVRTS